MSVQEDRTRFLEPSTRLRIAEACRGQWLTRYELAMRLGRKAGSLSQPKTMVARGALETRSRPRGSDGGGATAYRLSPKWRPALDAALVRSAPSWPATGQDLIFVPLAEVEQARALLAEGLPGLAWGTRVVGGPGGVGGLLLAPSPDPDGAATIAVVTALETRVERLQRLQMEDVMSGDELRRWAARLGGSGPALPPGS